MKRLIISLLTICMILGMTGHAAASEVIETKRSDTAFFVNGARMPLRAYIIEGNTYIDLFEIAITLSGSEKQFFPRWDERNQALSIISGIPYTAIGLNLSRVVSVAEYAVPKSISVNLNGVEVIINAYYIGNNVYFNLRQIAGVFDFCIVSNPSEKTVDLVTRLTYADSFIARRSVDPSKPMIALTFDDGPSQHTITILDALEQYGAVATFFVTGNRIAIFRNIVQRAFNMGNEISNHSWSHKLLTRLSKNGISAQILAANAAIESVTGAPPSNMRPTYGAINDRVIYVAAELELPMILWSLDPSDWLTRDPDKTYERIMENVKDKDIILLHDLHEPTAEAMVRVIPALVDRGFQLVTVSELMYYSGITPEPGEIYRSAAQ